MKKNKKPQKKKPWLTDFHLIPLADQAELDKYQPCEKHNNLLTSFLPFCLLPLSLSLYLG